MFQPHELNEGILEEMNKWCRGIVVITTAQIHSLNLDPYQYCNF